MAKKYVFDLLKAEDIEVRIGQMNKDRTKAVLLLYKTARTDSKYLDETLGADNWQCKFYECKGYLFCSVGIYLEDRKEWIWKDDAGAPSDIETDKGHASDAFKRACYKLGLGKELYSSPEIKWVDVEDKYDRFYVKEIGYNDDRQITTLVICREDNDVVCFEYRNGRRIYNKNKSTQAEAVEQAQNNLQDTSAPAVSMINEFQKKSINSFLNELPSEKRISWYQWMERNYKTKEVSKLTYAQAVRVINYIADYKKKGGN